MPKLEQLPGESDRDYRRRYHREWERQDRIKKGLPVRTPKGVCSIEGCDQKATTKDKCHKHYHQAWSKDRANRTDLPAGKRRHPLYIIWNERKLRGGLCDEWLDFEAFIAGVGERPGPDYFLARRTAHADYGPDNFVWKQHIRRMPGESDKAFFARKWQAQKERRPDFDKRRHLVRAYGITEARYEEMFSEQSGLCAICRKAETHIDKVRGTPKSLAVDHCHRTGVVRDLLCWTCNSTLGKIGESVDLLRAMIGYLEKWSDPITASAGRPEPVKPYQHEVILETEWGPLKMSDAARKAGLRVHTVIARRARGWPDDRLLIPLRRPQRKGL
jgi:hypothetical protein